LKSLNYDVHVERMGKDDKAKSGFNLVMKRKVDVYIYTYFFPCGLMVVCSWVSFAVKVKTNFDVFFQFPPTSRWTRCRAGWVSSSPFSS
jgi:hypothetical protein